MSSNELRTINKQLEQHKLHISQSEDEGIELSPISAQTVIVIQPLHHPQVFSNSFHLWRL